MEQKQRTAKRGTERKTEMGREKVESTNKEEQKEKHKKQEHREIHLIKMLKNPSSVSGWIMAPKLEPASIYPLDPSRQKTAKQSDKFKLHP